MDSILSTAKKDGKLLNLRGCLRHLEAEKKWQKKGDIRVQVIIMDDNRVSGFIYFVSVEGQEIASEWRPSLFYTQYTLVNCQHLAINTPYFSPNSSYPLPHTFSTLLVLLTNLICLCISRFL